MSEQMAIEFNNKKTIKGYPELHWTGKRPYTSAQYYPAQLKESYGETKDGWMNKIFWGDNLQVMGHMLKDYRGRIDLIYIDPPFDSKADYKKKIKIKEVGEAKGDTNTFEEKQYSDIWTNDEYLQFMYERLTIMKELLSENGSIIVHCDYHKCHHLRCVCDEIFGVDNFRNEISWCYGGGGAPEREYPCKHDNLLWYSKSEKWTFNKQYRPYSEGTVQRGLTAVKGENYKLDDEGAMLNDWWAEKEVQKILSPTAYENLKYPTQKPEGLLKRIILGHSNPGDLVFDCFMGSGTTQAVSMKLGRKFIGADINLGAIQTTTKRLISDIKKSSDECYRGFELYNVNNYEFFRNPIEAKELLIDALDIQKFDSSSVYDGELDGYMVKIMPVNRIATKADLESLKANLPYKAFDKRKEENPNAIIERIRIICMGHEADLKASLEQDLSSYNIDIDIVDILKEKKDLQFKRESDATVIKEDGELIIKEFYPMNLLQKLSMQKESVDNWKQLVESVVIDWNYDGEVMRPSVCDVPGRKELVKGKYIIPEEVGTIKIKITDILSESIELEV